MKPRETTLGRRIARRDAALRRLRRTTAMGVAGASALAVAFGGLAARGFSGHGATASPRSAAAAPVLGGHAGREHAASSRVAVRPPVLVPVSAAAPAPAPPPAPPTVAPVSTPAPPVAVSGGS